MADVTKRINYFDRQFLRAADFQDGQSYDLDRRRRHNRLLHAPGVGEGLAVTANINDAFVTVAAGTAYDALGQEIVLSASQQVNVSAVAGAAATAFIVISYAEQASDPSTDPGVTGSTRMAEQPALAALASVPAQTNLQIPLASVALANGKVSAAPDNTIRNQAGAVLGQDVTIHSVTLRNDAVASSTWPKLVCSAANTAAFSNAGLVLSGTLSVNPSGLTGVGSPGDTRAAITFGASDTPSAYYLGAYTKDTRANTKLGVYSYQLGNWVQIWDASGNVGIGTATPDRHVTVQGSGGTYLNVRDNSAGGPYEILVGADGGGGIVSTMTNHDLQLRSGSNNAHMTVKTDGKVGIGTTTPDRQVTLQGSNGTYLNVRDTGDTGGPYEILVGADGGGGIVSTMTNHDLQLRSGSNNTHVIVKNDGKVGIGMLTPASLLDVADRIRLRQGANGSAGLWLFQTTPAKDQAFIGIANDTQVGLWGNTGAQWGLVMDTGTGNVAIGLGATSTTAGKLDVGGAVHASSFPTSSDERFKVKVAPITDALEKVAGIRGVAFEWNELYESLGRSTGRREIGVIAQDVEKVCPELVSTWNEEGYKAVDYGRLTALLVEAIKELKAKNESLEQRLEAIEKSLDMSQPSGMTAAASVQKGRAKRSGKTTEPEDD